MNYIETTNDSTQEKILWTQTNVFLTKNNPESEIFFLVHQNKQAAQLNRQIMQQILDHEDIDLPSRLGLIYLDFNEEIIYASRYTLLNYFKGNLLQAQVVPLMSRSTFTELTKTLPLLDSIYMPEKKEFELHSANPPLEPEIVDDFFGQKDLTSSGSIIKSALQFSDLIIKHHSPVLWIKAPSYQHKQMLFAYGTTKQKASDLYQQILKRAENIKFATSDMAKNENTLLVSYDLLKKIFGEPQYLDNLNIRDYQLPKRTSYISNIFKKWDSINLATQQKILRNTLTPQSINAYPPTRKRGRPKKNPVNEPSQQSKKSPSQFILHNTSEHLNKRHKPENLTSIKPIEKSNQLEDIPLIQPKDNALAFEHSLDLINTVVVVDYLYPTPPLNPTNAFLANDINAKTSETNTETQTSQEQASPQKRLNPFSFFSGKSPETSTTVEPELDIEEWLKCLK